jgi:hypothetical protein
VRTAISSGAPGHGKLYVREPPVQKKKEHPGHLVYFQTHNFAPCELSYKNYTAAAENVKSLAEPPVTLIQRAFCACMAHISGDTVPLNIPLSIDKT